MFEKKNLSKSAKKKNTTSQWHVKHRKKENSLRAKIKVQYSNYTINI